MVRYHAADLRFARAIRLRREILQAERRVGQKPRPVTLNAAFSPPGRAFAAKAADFLFTTFVDIEEGREHIDDMNRQAREQGREVGVYTTCLPAPPQALRRRRRHLSAGRHARAHRG
jgi:alkanesulfonate monooxygenase SsuD/methylene tetrahydromethanopterin reductase-like flavin-dependent oxidoreductase (luciferase family)